MSAARPSILVIRRRYLGDIVLLGSVFRNLRLHEPLARLSALVEAPYAPVLGLNPDVDSTLTLPRGLLEWPGFLRKLRRARYTHVFDFDNTEKTAAIARLSGAPFRLVLSHGFPVKLRRCYTHHVEDPAAEHETRPITEYYLRALPAAGVPVITRTVRLTPRDEDLTALRAQVGAAGPVLLVHPGSRSAWRRWPAERFAAVCDHAQDHLGAQAVLVGGPGEQDLIAEIRRHARTHVLTLAEPLSLPRFAALAQLSRVLLCHDSGPMHVAAAVGTPVVALYGSQNAALFRPVGDDHILLQPPLPCVACVTPGQCTPGDSYHNRCVQNVPVAAALTAVERLLRRPRSAVPLPA
jgi:ADP-heptose:LPS heptosyltransferase